MISDGEDAAQAETSTAAGRMRLVAELHATSSNPNPQPRKQTKQATSNENVFFLKVLIL